MALFKTLEAFVVVKRASKNARASRYFLPGHICWHIHRCHKTISLEVHA